MLTDLKFNKKNDFIIKVGFTDILFNREISLNKNKTHNNLQITHKILLVKKINDRLTEENLYRYLHEKYPELSLIIKKNEKIII